MQPGRQKRRVAPSDAGIQQHDPPSLPPPDQAAPDQWDKYWLQTANSTENAYHNQPPQTGYHATQQLYVDPFFNHGNTTAMRPVGPLGFDRNTFVGGSSQSSAAVTQQALFSSNQAIPHSSYHIHDATVYGSLAQLTSSNGSFLDDGIFNSDQTVQNSFQGDRQFPAFVDTSQPGHVVAPPRYSLRDPNQGMRQVSRDNSKTYDNPNIPPAQHGNLVHHSHRVQFFRLFARANLTVRWQRMSDCISRCLVPRYRLAFHVWKQNFLVTKTFRMLKSIAEERMALNIRSVAAS